MPEKEFTQWLEGAILSASWRTDQGEVTAFCVMLLAEIEGQTHCVARYDSVHGTPHQDILGIRKGLLEKEWFFESSNREVLQYAIRDFKSHAADYICFYRAN